MSDLKKNSSAVKKGAPDEPVEVAPADVRECVMERLDDFELAEIVRTRRHETPIPVNLEDL
ncbi:antitoxin [Pseudomonas frederiksbergensis]|uniref:antitoxin n=1 Tax=Pseudomonas frederiksbergensis TaxID=104087 RepID=UPI002182518C|nr:antitoxin [Pseudomonas frederiksbergensis]